MRILFLTMILVMFVHGSESYKFGVFPHMPLQKLHMIFSAVTQDLENELGRPVVLMSKPYYKLYKDELNKGVYDIAFIQPLDYVQAHQEQGYFPLARRAKDLKAIMVVSKASSYKNVEDVKKKVIASAPAEAAVTQLMLESLEQKGFRVLDDFTLSYSKNHFVCLQKLVDGIASACITAPRAMKFFNQENKVDDFRVIYETSPIPHALFVVHPRIPEQQRKIIQKRILAWNVDDKGKELLRKGRLLNFIEAKDEDYEIVRQFLKSRD